VRLSCSGHQIWTTLLDQTPLDTLLALKALVLMPDLAENDRRICATLIEHYSRKTGRCDPGISRIAWLLNLDRRTVIRSLKRLEAADLLTRVRHGGRSNRNDYQLNWTKLREFETQWSARFKSGSRERAVSPNECRPMPALGGNPVTQTYRRTNLLDQTCSEGRPNKKDASFPGHNRQQTKPLTNRSADVARIEAERRWSGDLLARYASAPLTYGEIVDAINDELREAATDAELRNLGAGVTHIERALGVLTGPSTCRGEGDQISKAFGDRDRIGATR
jgi:hypothetical protein